ncbi:MAG: outer membrane protein assembly factor BamD [Betaproteobacteria bacterium]|nr:outer membrane protein assembly factor BamD [Betaproteobacteria bacterium]
MRSSLLTLALFVVLLFATSCSSDLSDETRDWSAEKLFQEAKDAAELQQWRTAIKYFEKLQARFPYGRLAQQAVLEAAYANWKDQEPALAIATVDRFIKDHPNHPNVDYAYYLKGLINFTEADTWFGSFSGMDMTERDPKSMHEAFDAFRELTTRYPQSVYAQEALERMRWLVNALASHEVHVARWYMKRSAWLAAALRAQHAVKTFPRAPATEEALFIMIRAYDSLGMNTLRDDADRVMRRNFPKSKYYGDAETLTRDVPWWRLWDPDW